jgi:CRP/FNR family transcriptional regulator, cyclic AMP receptor protein
MTPVPAAEKRRKFNLQTFLSTINSDRTIAAFPHKRTIFAQGNAADSVFYIQKGKVKLIVVAQNGKEATIGILNKGDFFGEGCLTGQPSRMCSAVAMIDCEVMRIDKKSMMDVIHREREFSDMFVAYLLTRNIRYQEDLVDQLFNSSEKRTGQNIAIVGSLRQGREARSCDSQNQSRNSSRDGGNNSRAGQLFHEQVQEARLHSL